MKFPSISLAIATVIACNAIAAPGPLHARASEDVNLLERGLNLYRRLFSAPMGQEHRERHHETVRLIRDTIQADTRAMDAFHHAAHVYETVHPVDLGGAQELKEAAEAHRTSVSELCKLYVQHAKAAKNPHPTNLLDKVHDHKRQAQMLEKLAMERIEIAKEAIRCHKL